MAVVRGVGVSKPRKNLRAIQVPMGGCSIVDDSMVVPTIRQWRHAGIPVVGTVSPQKQVALVKGRYRVGSDGGLELAIVNIGAPTHPGHAVRAGDPGPEGDGTNCISGNADVVGGLHVFLVRRVAVLDRKSTRLNSSHLGISYAVFCLNKN